MTLTEAKERLAAEEPDFLDKAKRKVNGRNTYICPICGNGSGKDGDGITLNPHSKAELPHYKCLVCGTNADIIDLWRYKYGKTDFHETINALCERYHIDYRHSPNGSQQRKASAKKTAPSQTADFTEYYKKCSENLKKSKEAQEYLRSRGISLEEALKYNLGFDDKADPANAPAGRGTIKYPTPRIIVPFDSLHYMGRDISGKAKIDKLNNKNTTDNGGIPPFNGGALHSSSEPLFITEGAFDAISVLIAGGEAVAINSTANAPHFVEIIREQMPERPLIIAQDSDSAGAGAAATLRKGLDELGKEYYTPPEMPANVGKDYNDYLTADRAGFTAYIQKAIETAKRPAEERREEYYNNISVYGHIQSFIDGIGKSSTAPFYSTGFESLDKVLDGGLYSGLYCIGAISSLGKTTFCLQIADNLAQAGHDVLLFSLEMSREELMSKSISRLTYTINREKGGEQLNAKTTRGIMTGRRYAAYNQEERQLIGEAIEAYSEYAKQIFISVGMGNIGINEIRERIEQHKRQTGRAPIVIIDYLQIIAPTDPHFTDKQNTDKAVLELKRISRDLETPIIGISSFNRDNYKEPVNLASFKESGAIEYSSDVLIGLQYLGMDYEAGDGKDKGGARTKRLAELFDDMNTKGRQGKSQPVQVKILKNRNGSKGDAVLDFYPMFNYFEESTTHTAERLTQEDSDSEKGELYAAFSNAADGNTASINEIAANMGRRATTVKKMLKNYPEFTIDGDTVTLED